MTNRRLLFHVGSHKTGTTALQRAFAASRDHLARHGVVYPDLMRPLGRFRPEPNHSAVVRAAEMGATAGRLARIADDLDRTVPDGGVAFLSAELAYRLAADGVVWSEGDRFWDARRRLLERLLRAFDTFDVTFLLYLRRPDRLAESHYAESIAATEVDLSFDAYVATKPYRYDYARQVDLLRGVAPTVVRSYEAARRGGLLASVCAVLGIAPFQADLPSLRRSIPIRAQQWMFRAKSEGAMEKLERDRRWLFALERGDTAPFDGPPASPWASTGDRDAFLEAKLSGFTELSWDAAEAVPPRAAWTEERHAAAERAFGRWCEVEADRIARREAARLRPFEDGVS